VHSDFPEMLCGRAIRGAGKRIPEAASFYDMAAEGRRNNGGSGKDYGEECEYSRKITIAR